MTTRFLFLCLAALLAVLPAGEAAAGKKAASIDWTKKVAVSPVGGFVMGNPAAGTKLVEYISYTCPHCAHFTSEATEPLKAGWIRSGKVSLEIRPVLRGAPDVPLSLLARCGGPARFFGNSEALFANQDAWFLLWETYSNPRVLKPREPQELIIDIAENTGLIPFMVKRGFSPAQITACLKDMQGQKQLAAMTDEAWNKVKITGTPGFTVNGKLIDAHDWDSVKAALPALPN